MSEEMRNGTDRLELVYDNTGEEKAPTFSELIDIFALHVNNEENLVVPLLDYVGQKAGGCSPESGGLRNIAEEFSLQYKGMEEEHEEARLAVHRLAELSRITGNMRAYKVWNSIENHVKLEQSALKLANSGAREILHSQ